MTPEQMQMQQMQQGQQMTPEQMQQMQQQQQMQQMQIPMQTGATSWEQRTISNEPDPSKMIYTGKVRKNTGENGFLSCPETYATYQRDVYMWKSYCQQCVVGDYVKFQLHISEKGLPQVSWLQKTWSAPPPSKKKEAPDGPDAADAWVAAAWEEAGGSPAAAGGEDTWAGGEDTWAGGED